MRSPGLRRMVHTRTRSLSDTSALPTQGLGLFFSRSNSAKISGGHGDFIAVSGCLSSIVRAMAFLQVWPAWERVYRLLRDAFPPEHYHRGRGVSGFVQTERSVLAQFGDGGAAEGDLLVGADGLRSTIRQQCLPQLLPSYAGYVAWRALIAEATFAPTIHRELFDSMVFCLPPGEQD